MTRKDGIQFLLMFLFIMLTSIGAIVARRILGEPHSLVDGTLALSVLSCCVGIRWLTVNTKWK